VRLALALLVSASPLHAAVHDLAPVASFHYQLQNLDVAAVSSSPFPLLVTDDSLDGSAAGELTPAEVTSLRSGGRTVLAYLSIGEAETYRFYWDSSWIDEGNDDPDRPPWLGPVNPQFPDNIKVRFWDPAWQAIVRARTSSASWRRGSTVRTSTSSTATSSGVPRATASGPRRWTTCGRSSRVWPRTCASTVPPTFTWSANGGSGYELRFSGTSWLTKVRKLPRGKDDVISGKSFTPDARDWTRVGREARKGDGVTLYWWVAAIDAGGVRRSAPLRSLNLTP
jgi:hypothetical protein